MLENIARGKNMNRIKQVMRSMVMVVCFIALITCRCYIYAADIDSNVDTDKITEIETYVNKCIKKGKIPGMALTIVTEDRTYTKCYGYSNKKTNETVDEHTKFELASNSKAYTATAIMQLVKENKVLLEDPVSKYIPELTFYYGAQKVDVTIEQLLHHTSGIPYSTIQNLFSDNSNDALKNTVMTLDKVELSHEPGEKFQYATINYDVLGYVIEVVTGESFEEYMTKNVFQAYGLDNTFCLNDAPNYDQISQGYMFYLGSQKAYETPQYRGDTPAGYIYSDITDLSEWLKIQLGISGISEDKQEVIDSTHEVNRLVAPDSEGNSYAAGWENCQNGMGEYKHSGTNQYFSSYIMFQTEKKLGIAVVCNTNTEYAELLVEKIADILQDTKTSSLSMKSDTNKSIDKMSIVVMVFDVLVIASVLYVSIKSVMKKEIDVYYKKENKISNYLLLISIFVSLFLAIYKVPYIFGDGVNWNFIYLWMPITLKYAVVTTVIALLILLVVICMLFVKGKTVSGNLVPVLFFSAISGAGNALVIFAINMSLDKVGADKFKLFLYLAIGLILYVGGQVIVRSDLVSIANNMIYQKRKELIHKFLSAPYEEIERNISEEFCVTLNNDTEVVSDLVNVLISAITNIVTILFCGIYLYCLNKIALLFASIIILLIASLYFIFGEYANKINEGARDTQNIFFAYIEDIRYGIKELLINNRKKKDFETDTLKVCQGYKEQRIKGARVYAYLFILGELLFTIAVALVAFVFPIVLEEINNNELESYVFVLLYMTGPINSLLDAIPRILNINISWKRIENISKQIGDTDDNVSEVTQKNITLELKNVKYCYQNDDGSAFELGPLNLKFKSGQITFVTGGNGSGKSTFAKIISGLYRNTSGKITINGLELNNLELGEYYTTVFSDFHLFEKLYGIDVDEKKKEIDEYLRMLQLDKKVKVEDGKFSTTDLSTGQKKRLALLVSLLEDKDIYLFDEWAADQDPLFRKFFYTEILLKLKEKGKCIIAITHDDKYFDLADQRIKFEYGKIAD